MITLLTACGGTVNTRYYSFPGINPAHMSSIGHYDKIIVVGPITLHEAIDHPQLMIKRSETKTEILENDRWANSLEKEVQKLAISSMSRMLGSSKIMAFPWTGTEQAAYRVSLEIIEMSAMPGKEALLTVSWTIYNENTLDQTKLPATDYRGPVSESAELEEIVKIYQGLHLRSIRDLSKKLLVTMQSDSGKMGYIKNSKQ